MQRFFPHNQAKPTVSSSCRRDGNRAVQGRVPFRVESAASGGKNKKYLAKSVNWTSTQKVNKNQTALVNEIENRTRDSPSYKTKTKNMKKKDIIGLQCYK